MSAHQLLCHLQFQPWPTGEMSGSAQGIKQKTAHVCMTFQKVSPHPKFPDGLQGNIPKGIQNFSQRGCLQHLSNIHPCELCTELYAVLQTCGKWTYSRRRLLWISKIERTSGASSAAASNRLEIFFVKEGTPMLHVMSHPTCHKSSSSLEKTRMAFYMPSKHKIFTSWKILWNIAQMKIL